MKFEIAFCDPPWRYNDKGCNGACENHYGTLSIQDLCNLPVADICAENCILFLWVTYPMLKEGLRLIDSWSFRYKTIGFQWIKLNLKNGKPFFGLGRWTRGNSECCLIATKGKPKRIHNGISQLIFSPIEAHSKKPDIVREKIVELMGDLPRIEFFARQHYKGWTCIGNEIDGKDIRESLDELKNMEATS